MQPFGTPQPQQFPSPGNPYTPVPPQPTQPLGPPYDHYDEPPQRGHRPPSDFELRFREHVQSSIANPPRPKRKVWPIFLALFLVLILGGGGAAAYFLMQQQGGRELTAEERFTHAVAAHLQTPYINQDYDMHMDMNGLTADIKIKSSMDVTDPASPKISGSYTLSSNKGLNRAVNFVVTSKTKAYMSYDQAETLDSSGLKPKTWYSYDPSDHMLGLAVDPLGLIGSVNTARGEVPVGKFSEEQQATILSQISSASPYTITNITEDGSALRYDITISTENYKKLDTVVAKLVGEDSDSTADAAKSDTQMQIWIDKQTNRIVKAASKKDMGTSTVTISYPPHYDGKAPANSLDMMKALQANTPTDAQAPVKSDTQSQPPASTQPLPQQQPQTTQ